MQEKSPLFPCAPTIHSPPHIYDTTLISYHSHRYKQIGMCSLPPPALHRHSSLLLGEILYCLSLPIKRKNIFHKDVLINFIRSVACTDGKGDLLGIIKSNSVQFLTRVCGFNEPGFINATLPLRNKFLKKCPSGWSLDYQ